MSIQRYKRRGPEDALLAQYVPSGARVDVAGPEFVDIDLTNDNERDDLSSLMDSLGYAFDSTSPSTPGDEITDAAHGERSGGTLHSLVSSADHGFMSVADKDKLDGYPAFTAGSIPFGVSGGGLSEDNANLFWDDANDRLGIGQAVPLSPLHVLDNGALGVRWERTSATARTWTVTITAAGNFVIQDTTGAQTVLTCTSAAAAQPRTLQANNSGTATAPSWSFAGDANTGIFNPAADQLGLSAGGAARCTVTTLDVQTTVAVRTNAGTAANPAHSFTSDSDTGLFIAAANALGIAAAGAEQVRVTVGRLQTFTPTGTDGIRLQASGVGGDIYVQAEDSTASAAPAGTGRLRYNDTTKLFETSTDTGGYNAGVGSLRMQLPSFTVATLPAVGAAAGLIYVSDESGGAVPAFSDGTNWRRVTDRAIVT